ncbi:hypothetical protein [uncultured Roseobacter sp.]|uniref:hypothetical protein n=1 Tax=uncultured Roseobacter sp. TaxID=114847 RepID=UPI002616A84F|nr:hypothetical protein [uncultured Roseobacter sp.]
MGFFDMEHMVRTTALSVAFCYATASSARAEAPVCMPTAEMEAALVEWHGEQLVAEHHSGGKIWAAGTGGSWTLISYRKDGLSCTLAHGENWSLDMAGDDVIADYADVIPPDPRPLQLAQTARPGVVSQ